ncbi:hypothetical protein [Leptolyngbya sp. Cla-17]|uniref:hypothetical protein n=1 Tax=Leptolyngbya sp. Cla-17 TaxID=2803751 RepID=UPI0014916EF6|nr:hypothetical protein [Leptolyngbya sp. Cla-17]
MQKIQCWVIGGMVSVASLALSNAVGAIPMQLDYFCYQQQMTGRVKDLTGVCQSSQRTNSASATTQMGTPIQKNASSSAMPSSGKPNGGKKLVSVESGAKRVLEFSDLNYEDGVLVGFARNKTGKQIGEVSINYVVLERESETKWKPVYSGSARTQANSLKAGEKTTFTAIPRTNGDKIVIMKAEF